MKFNKSQISKEIKTLEETISFNEVAFPLLELSNIKVKATLFKDNELINVSFTIKGTARVACSRTLESIDYPLDFTTSIDISDNDNNEDTYYVPTNLVDLNPIIYELIRGEIPTQVFKKGSKLHIEGDGYRVLTEEELNKERAEEKKYNPAFDKLKDIDL